MSDVDAMLEDDVEDNDEDDLEDDTQAEPEPKRRKKSMYIDDDAEEDSGEEVRCTERRSSLTAVRAALSSPTFVQVLSVYVR